MEYRNTKYFISKWHINERRIRKLCSEGRIENAIKVGKTWLIPIDASKPIDMRYKTEKTLYYAPVFFDEVDEKKKYIDSLRPLSTRIVKQLRDKLIVEWTYNSNAIEGNTLTMSETKVVLETGITIQGKSLKDHLEIINHKEAIEFIECLVDKKTSLTEFDIKSLHQLILKEIDCKNAGVYRKENVLISGALHVPPSHFEVPFEMQKLIINYNSWSDLHPIVRACMLHGEFVKIHPFVDGNGRTARLLLNFELIRNGYPPVIIKNTERFKYYEALDKAHITNDYTDFINLIIDLVIESEKQYMYLLG